MNVRKTIDVTYTVKAPEGFKTTKKYRLASVVCVVSEKCAFWNDYGIAIAFERNGKPHIITHGAMLTKSCIMKSFIRGEKFICVGQKACSNGKVEPIYEIIAGE